MDRDPKEFFWGCELSKDNASHTWSFEEEEDDIDYLSHTLFVRSAVLGSASVKGELNIVQVETKTYGDKQVKHALFSLRGGTQESVTSDISFPGSTPAIFRLVEGSGPVHLCGQHLVEFPPNTDEQDYYTEDEELEEELEEGEEEEEETSPKKKALKRKAISQPKAKSKKGKMEISEDEEEEEEEEEDDEEMDEEGDEEELDDEEEEETPKKTKKKSTKATQDSKGMKIVRKVHPTTKANARKPVARKIRK